MSSMTREMKDSGVEWIKNVPQNWQIEKIKHLGKASNGLTYKPQDQRDESDGILVLRASNIQNGRICFEDNVFVDRKIAYKSLVSSGSILICSCNGSPNLVGKCCMIPKDLTAAYGGFMLLFEPTKIHSPFAFYVFNSGLFDAYRPTFKTTTINQLTVKNFYSLPIPLPSEEEQKRIANYLDSKCSQIDQLSANIKQQIEEMVEYKKALITQAVTKGLDPDAEMKDSGIEWVGKIPSHWSILRIANIYTERSETGCMDDLPILMVSINSGVSDGEVLDEERTRMVVRSEDKLLYKRVYPDDLVYNTMRAWQGAFGAVRVNGLVSPAYVTAAPKVDIDSRYIEALLRTPSAKEEMKRYSYGIADFRMRLYWQYFKNISVALPPLDEQHYIASFIDSKCSKIDSIIKTKNELLKTLQDYKKSLIYDYVTGKREVPASYRKDGCYE